MSGLSCLCLLEAVHALPRGRTRVLSTPLKLSHPVVPHSLILCMTNISALT